jgi:multidrug efflux system outer membrane protein
MKRMIAAGSVLALGACSMDPTYVRLVPPIPAAWPRGIASMGAPADAALPSLSYRDVMRDPRLLALIEQGLANNRDLRLAAANIAEARANLQIQQAQQLPQLDTNAAAGYSNAGSRGAGTGALSGDVGLAAFEIDLFGRLASLTRAEQQRLFATEAAARAVRLTLTADIADSWLAYARDSTLLDIAEKTVITGNHIVGLTRLRFENKVAPRSDVMQAEQILQTARADVADQRTALDQDVDALRLLVGAEIERAALPTAIEAIGESVTALPVGVDSRVLLRRPDVVEAEYTLRAENAEIGAARAALFPQISLTGALGLASGSLAALFTGGAFANSTVAQATYPIFRGGAARAKVTVTRARRDAALATYEHTIQTAFKEVSDALARRATIEEKLTAVTLQAQAADGAFRMAEMRYRGAIEPFLSALDAQRTFYAAQRTLADTRFAVVHNRVVLYHRIGGDALIDALPIDAKAAR